MISICGVDCGFFKDIGMMFLILNSFAKTDRSDTDNKDKQPDDGFEFDILSSSFGPAQNQWPRVKVQPNSLILNSKQTSVVNVTILFHPDRESSDVHATAIEILTNEGSWTIPVNWS